MNFMWEDMISKTSKQVKDGFHEITKQVNQLVDSDLPDFPKNNRPWGCKCGTIVDSKYDFCPKCGTSRKELIKSFLEEQAIHEFEMNCENMKKISDENQRMQNENQRMQQEIKFLNGKCFDLRNNLDTTKNTLNKIKDEYNDLKDKYQQIQRELDEVNKVNVKDESANNNYRNSGKSCDKDYTNISYLDFLHDVYDGYTNLIENEAENLKCFDTAVEYKRAGRFSEAIDMQVKSIRYYFFDPNLKGNFYSMAKTYYLMKQYDDSLNCYRIYLQLGILQNMDTDFEYLLNLFKNMGHSVFDEKNKNEKRMEIEYYRSELVNKPLDNEQYRMMSAEYDRTLINQISSAAYIDIAKMGECKNNTLPSIKTMMLHYTRLHDMNFKIL